MPISCKNAIYCGGCITVGGPLSPDPEFRHNQCLGSVLPIDGRPIREVLLVGDEKLGSCSIVLLPQ